MKKLIVLIAFIANIFAMQAQVRFIVQPLFEGVFSQDRVFQFSDINNQTQGNAQGFISIALTKLNGEPVANYQSAIISLKPSEVQNGVAMDWQKSARFASNEEGKRSVQQKYFYCQHRDLAVYTQTTLRCASTFNGYSRVDNSPFMYLKHGLDGETIKAKPLLKFNLR